MIGYGIYFNDRLCKVEGKGTYAICFKKEFAEDYAKDLSAVMLLKYTVKKVIIEALE